MSWGKRSRDEILENLKHFGNAKEKKLGLYGDEYIRLDGSEISESVYYLQVKGFGNARLEILGWGGELELLGELDAKIVSVDKVEINTAKGAIITCKKCKRVRVWGAQQRSSPTTEASNSTSPHLLNCGIALESRPTIPPVSRPARTHV